MTFYKIMIDYAKCILIGLCSIWKCHKSLCKKCYHRFC